MANYKNIGEQVAPAGIPTTYASNEALAQAILDATDWTQLPYNTTDQSSQPNLA